MNGRGAPEPEVYRITAARRSHTDDLNRRINRYLISMAIRTACVVLVFVVHGPFRWVFAAGAIFLPYVAVIFANAADRRQGTATSRPVEHRGLSSGRRAEGSAEGPDGDAPVVLEGQVITGRPKPPAPEE